MNDISSIIKERLEYQKKLDFLTRRYTKEKDRLNGLINELNRKEMILASGLDLRKVELGRKLLKVKGNPYVLTDGATSKNDNIATLAIEDIIKGCPHLRKKFFGNKEYSSFHQRCDCKYGMTPVHGTITEQIALADPNHQLTPEEAEAAAYYLWSWPLLNKNEF